MITQVIDREGIVYDVEYPKRMYLRLRAEVKPGIIRSTGVYTDQLEERGYRPYMIDGELAPSGLEPWERYRFDGAKTMWDELVGLLEREGFVVTHNGRDMFIQKDEFKDVLIAEEVFNFSPEENVQLILGCYKS